MTSLGCVVTFAGGLNGCWGGTRVWSESTETFPLDTAGLKALVVRTHNGAISLDAQEEGTAEAVVTVTKKAGGRNQAQADDALAAIEVYVKPTGKGTTKIGWKWKTDKRPDWRSQVSFAIKAPGHLHFDGETHNGAIEVGAVAGDVSVVTHNGRINVESSEGKLYAETHNGAVTVSYAGPEVHLQTHNGRVVANLERCDRVHGEISTHNGSVQVVVGESTSADLKCGTHNGGISCNAPITDKSTSRRRLTGRLGSGGGTLEVTTHNGGIRVIEAEG